MLNQLNRKFDEDFHIFMFQADKKLKMQFLAKNGKYVSDESLNIPI